MTAITERYAVIGVNSLHVNTNGDLVLATETGLKTLPGVNKVTLYEGTELVGVFTRKENK